ncbi:unnamed protein product [Cylindrotheca closterium]|uniref:Uncharacterized protein n=1 Tax=Cylindrotheca closterium TaxID=2856 RepID=A0AAD2G417_9STRA|nr:unnamed protein product [Cylindrotheca closterium]
MMIANNGRSSLLSPRSTFQLCMVRNIDLVEAIIFYGKDSLFVADDGNDENDSNLELLLAGVENLVDECIRDETAVLAILPNDNVCNDDSYLSVIPKEITIHRELQTPPNPRDLWTAIHSTQVQPKGFGGSSGFGRKAADPERSPLPKHCVVLCHTEHQCRAARFAGMRVLCLTDNDLADGIMLDDCWESICMDDIATPGSFWLNPPHPKDDEGNAIDIDQVMAFFESSSGGEESEGSNGVPGSASSEYVAAVSEELDDDQLAAMLADIDSL